ncbi:MAG TPA: hypothetical protein VF571_18235 [Pyrinomonadaceae bacterium]|jgi:hypothetical protein
MSSQKNFRYCFFAESIFAFCFLTNISASAQDDEPPEIINKIPKHIPLKVELENKEKKEVVKELRIKVTNSGDKPIYAIELFLEPLNLISPETGYPYGFRLQYGIKPGSTIYDLAEKDDDPLEPGESYIFQISKKKAETFRKGREKRNEIYPKQFKLGFQLITFGDGTGFHLGEGIAFPTKIGLKQNKNFDILDFQTPNVVLQMVTYLRVF